MKHKKPQRTSGSSQTGWIRVVCLALVFSGLFAGLLYLATSEAKPPKKGEMEIEVYIRSITIKDDVVPNLIPAVIYSRRPGMTKEEFCCVGTLCPDQDGNPQIITAEHIFRTDVRSEQIMSVRNLRGEMNPPVAYIGRIVATGKDLGDKKGNDKDIVIASLDLRETIIKPFSDFVYSEMAQSFWGDVVIEEKKIPRLRSLLTGKYVETLGYARRGEKDGGPVFVAINCHSRSGESGTGYVDDFGGLWVLHGGSSSEKMEKEAIAEAEKFTGKKVVGVSTVSGPLFGNYK